MSDQTATFQLPTAAALEQAAKLRNKTNELGDDGLKPGRVVDLDYGAWAVAIVDLSEKSDRVEYNRRKIMGKGYAKVGGKPIVIGFSNCEVYVISREMYEQNRARRRERLIEAVESGEMSPFALQTEHVQNPTRAKRR